MHTAYVWIDRITVLTTLPLWVLGFGFTIQQILKTKKAAEAAQKAALDTANELARNRVLVLLPMLFKIESDLEQAIHSGDNALVVYHLSSWRWQAGQLRPFLDLTVPEQKSLSRRIQSSITHTADAKMQLMKQPKDVIDVTRKSLATISAVTGELGGMAWTQTNTIGGGK